MTDEPVQPITDYLWYIQGKRKRCCEFTYKTSKYRITYDPKRPHAGWKWFVLSITGNTLYSKGNLQQGRASAIPLLAAAIGIPMAAFTEVMREFQAIETMRKLSELGDY